MTADRAYLSALAGTLRGEGFSVVEELAMGEPSDEIIKYARKHRVDLIAMSTHGHRFVSDLLYGSTADKVRHLVDVPVLLLKAKAWPGWRRTEATFRVFEEKKKGAAQLRAPFSFWWELVSKAISSTRRRRVSFWPLGPLVQRLPSGWRH
jgi:hypothetical protein